MMILRTMLLAYFLAWCTWARCHNKPRAPAAPQNPFASITPAEVLNWVPCSMPPSTEALECARVLVPFDYTKPKASAEQFSLAVIRIRADKSAAYKGPIFFNFGGPGESGTETLPLIPERLRQLVGQGYDLVSWDPRGVGSTLPSVACFADQAARERAAARLSTVALFEDKNSLAELDAQYQAVAAGCEQYSGRLLPYVGTVSAARDLNRLVELYGYSKKLSYVGVSYGTLLGAAFAHLFPDRVERMVLDGVVDPRYLERKEFPTFDYRDADLGLEDFFNLCYLAGPSRCAAWFDSPAAIRDAFFELDERIRASPIPVGTDFSLSSPLPVRSSRVLDWAQWRSLAYADFFSPLVSFSRLASRIGLGYKNQLPTLKEASQIAPEFPENNFLIDPSSGRKNGWENQYFVICEDLAPPDVEGPEEVLEYIEREQLSSKGLFAVNNGGTFLVQCSRLKREPIERLKGNVKNVKTAFPILLLNPMRDGATPVQSAIAASNVFLDSSLVTLNITGHTTISSPSRCVDDYVKRYLYANGSAGSLPRNGTVCQPDILPFGVLPDGSLAPIDA